MNLRRFLKRSGIAMLIMLPLIVLWIGWRMPWYISEWRQQAVVNIGEPISAVAVTDDGSLVALAHGEGIITLWWTDNRQPKQQWVAHKVRIDALTFIDNGATLLTGGRDGKVVVWDVTQRLKRFDVFTSFRPSEPSRAKSVSNFALCQNQNSAAIGSWDGSLVMFDTRSGQILNDNLQIWSQTASLQAMACSGTGSTLAFGIETGKVVLWDTATQQEALQLNIPAGVPQAMIFLPGDQEIAIAAPSTARRSIG